MAALPFILVVDKFYPLQPEDSEREEELRNDPRWKDHYRNLAEEYYAEIGCAGDAGKDSAQAAPQHGVAHKVSSDAGDAYRQWVDQCRSMDAEVERAKQEWRESMLHRDAEIARLRLRSEELRIAAKRLELRPKPKQPRSARKGDHND